MNKKKLSPVLKTRSQKKSKALFLRQTFCLSTKETHLDALEQPDQAKMQEGGRERSENHQLSECEKKKRATAAQFLGDSEALCVSEQSSNHPASQLTDGLGSAAGRLAGACCRGAATVTSPHPWGGLGSSSPLPHIEYLM